MSVRKSPKQPRKVEPLTEPSLAKMRPLALSVPTSEPESRSPQSKGPQTKIPPLLSEAGELRILDFDIENRPLSYWYEGATTAEVTAIACSWVGDPRIYSWVLGLNVSHPIDLLMPFRQMFDEADMVTGHFIRKHDLPIINGALAEFNLPVLGEKLTSDTKLDLIRWKDLPQSQESLAEMLRLADEKHHMSQADWRRANRLTATGKKYTQKRVVDDVIQHKAMRLKLLERKLLGPPKLWKPGGALHLR